MREPRRGSVVGSTALSGVGLRQGAEDLVEQVGEALGVDGADDGDLDAAAGDDRADAWRRDRRA